jgi:hypothetical protein
VAAHPSRRRASRGPQDEADQQRAAIVSNNEINNGTSAQRLIFQRVGAICSRQYQWITMKNNESAALMRFPRQAG